MSKIHETAKDRAEEEAVAAYMEKVWKLRFYKATHSADAPGHERLDYAVMCNDQLRMFAEVKRRYHKYGDYPTLLIDYSKWLHARHVFKSTTYHTALIIRWDDCTRVVPSIEDLAVSRPSELALEVGGRTKKTRDNADIEPVIHIPIQYFVPVEQFIGC